MKNASLAKPAMAVASYEGSRPHRVAGHVRSGDSMLLLLRFIAIGVYHPNFVIRDEVQRLVDREANRIACSSVPRMIVYFINQSERFVDERMTIRPRRVLECRINALRS